MYAFLAGSIILSATAFVLYKRYSNYFKQEAIQFEKDRQYNINTNHYFNLLYYKIHSFRYSDDECLYLIKELYTNYILNGDVKLCKANNIKGRLIDVLSCIARYRLEEHCKNIILLKELDQCNDFTFSIYHENESLIGNPKFHFQMYFSRFIKRYNRAFYKSVGTEFIENSFDMEAFLKDIEQIHDMYVKVKTTVNR